MLKKMWSIYSKYRDILLPILGTLMVSLIVLPYLILGEGSYVVVHDQMDGEILNYIYQAKYLFDGNIIPEFMNGMLKTAMLPPAPFLVLLYKVFDPFAAFAYGHWICLLMGFWGFWKLSQKLGVNKEIGCLVACVFCYMPLYPVYGLAIYGQPFLVYCFWRLLERDAKIGKDSLKYLLGIAFYAGMSSLTLVGYAWVALGFGIAFLLIVLKNKSAFKAVVGTGVLMLVYLLTNLELLSGLVGVESSTHRQEMKLTATEDLIDQGKILLFNGGAYAPVYSAVIVIAGILLVGIYVATCIYMKKSGKDKVVENACMVEKTAYVKKCILMMGIVVSAILLFVVLAVLWKGSAIVELRKSIGGMVEYFQADRIYWLFTFMWMLVMMWILEGFLAMKDCVQVLGKNAQGGRKTWDVKVIVVYGVIALLVMAQWLSALRDNALNKNLRLVVLDNYHQVTWESFYMEDVFEKIDKIVGEDKESKSVVSLGIYPSVALYNGYTCADGYSNNYSLEYKHAFREIIAKELDKNPDGKAYFDDWGNRVYMLANPYGNNAMIAKNQGLSYTEPEFDLEAFRAMNVGYIFSAAEIEFAESDVEKYTYMGTFSDEESYFEIWVYKIL